MELVNISKEFIESLSGNYNPVFNGIRIYGTIEDPYFPAKDVQELLKINLHYKDNDRLLRDGIDKIKIEIATSGGKQSVVALTELGLYKVLFLSKTEIAENFQTFVLVVLKRLRLTGSVTIQQAQEDYKKKIQELEKTVKMLDTQLVEEHTQLIKHKENEEFYYNRYQDTREQSAHLETQLEYAKSTEVTSLEHQLCLMKKKYMKHIYVYTVKAPKEHKETYEDYDFEETAVCEDEDYPLGVFDNEQKRGQLIGKVYIHKEYNISVVKSLVQKIPDIWVSPKKNTFIISFDELKRIIDDAMNSDLLKHDI